MPVSIDEETGRYLPVIYPQEKPYWEAAREERIVLQRCTQCSKLRYPIGPSCPVCLSSSFEWATMSGLGRVSSFVVYHKAFAKWLEPRIPYAVVQVELDEGPRLTTNIYEIAPENIRIGLRVEATFEKVNDEITLLQFKPTDRE